LGIFREFYLALLLLTQLQIGMDLCIWARGAMEVLDTLRSTSNGSPASVSLDQLRFTELGSRVELAKDYGPKAVKYGIWDTAYGDQEDIHSCVRYTA